ncbi:MAG: hypothetical protein Q8P62_01515 [Candidatus Peregrinibacteria bacterium]|nr:hypothetical protein [Candidatus Peregrinibacteria bacterium]
MAETSSRQPDFDYENPKNFIPRPTPNSQLAVAMDIESIRLPTRLFARKGRKELQIIANELFGKGHLKEIKDINKWKLNGAIVVASYINSALLSCIVALKPDLKGTPEIVEMLALAYLIPSIIIWVIDLAIAVPLLQFVPEMISKIKASRPSQKLGSQDARELLEEMANILALVSEVKDVVPENERKVLLEALILEAKELEKKMRAIESLLEEQSGSDLKIQELAISGAINARVKRAVIKKD